MGQLHNVLIMQDFSPVKLYISEGTITGIKELIDALKNGCGFFMTRGRGGTDRIRLSNSENEEIIILHNKNIVQLSHKDMYPICVLDECWHGKFDVGLSNIVRVLLEKPNYYQSDCIPECIAWRLVHKRNGGAIASLTNTNTCFGVPGDSNQNGIPDDAENYGGFLGVEVFRLYGDEDLLVLGDIHRATVENYVTGFPVHLDKIHCKSVLEWILIGDPSLIIGGYE
jgi:hypothetical protein